MKRIYFMLLLTAIIIHGCYEDKGTYNYNELSKVEVSQPDNSYNLFFGDKLPITPTVITTIPESDLAYDWEFYGNGPENPDTWWQQYVSVAKTKVLDYVCVQDEYLFKAEGTYKLRLNVTQVSTGSHFYSNVVEVKLSKPGLANYVGAMVLHGDGVSTDIGFIVAEEFQLKASTPAIETKVIPSYHSEINGETIKGQGKWILQIYPTYGEMAPDYILTVAVTDQSSSVNNKLMEKTGEWNDLFYGGLNKDIPLGCFIDGFNTYVFDGGDVFYKQMFDEKFVIPTFSGEASEYDLYPALCVPGSGSSIRGFLFDKNSRGFLGVINNLQSFECVPLKVDDGELPLLPFNPIDMQADLIYMANGGVSGHVMNVMKKDNGDYFIAEFDLMASSYTKMPRYAYDLTHVADVQNGKVTHWAFGKNYINMCYYATANGVFRFTADVGNVVNPEPLKMVDNSLVAFDGTVTLMKILNPTLGKAYYMANVEMVVGTYGGSVGTGKLYSLEIDPFSGLVKSVKNYSGFDKIYDVNIKGF